jgi:protein-tyrosine phosphatase
MTSPIDRHERKNVMTEGLSRLNFRDVGGLETEDGSLTRSGVIFRSEGPANFEAIHRRELEALKIRLVCDLRSDRERREAPNDWTGGARLLNLNVTDDLRAEPSQTWKTLLAADPSSETVKRVYLRNYAAIPGALRPHLRALIEAIAIGETPVVIHCTAGKDRTGVLIALLLKALHVPEAAVAADYMRSDVFAQNLRSLGGIHERMEKNYGVRPDDAFIDALIGVDLEYLRSALAAVEQEWLTIDGYFAAAGVGPELLDRYREVMTVSPEDPGPA